MEFRWRVHQARARTHAAPGAADLSGSLPAQCGHASRCSSRTMRPYCAAAHSVRSGEKSSFHGLLGTQPSWSNLVQFYSFHALGNQLSCEWNSMKSWCRAVLPARWLSIPAARAAAMTHRRQRGAAAACAAAMTQLPPAWCSCCVCCGDQSSPPAWRSWGAREGDVRASCICSSCIPSRLPPYIYNPLRSSASLTMPSHLLS